jgi:thiamine-monophosphate kinase
MTAKPEASKRPGEFELIARIFAPLARGAPGAFDLSDDVAVLTPRAGHEIVLKTDSLIEGVHFRRDDPPSTVGRKALRRALSDLAAKGAEPTAYLLALALPEWPDTNWLEAFALGLSRDQVEFGISLIGGETNATPGPVTITITAVGFTPEGKLTRRNGARPGDLVFVTGTVGDADAGLAILTEQAAASDPASEFLISRYQVPAPRLTLGRALRGCAGASIDVSDGLLADLGHVADASGVRVEIDAGAIPLSLQFRQIRGDDLDARLGAATAGDDYEIAFAAPSSSASVIREIGGKTSTEVTQIGRVTPGCGVALLDGAGAEIPVKQRGYTHF